MCSAVIVPAIGANCNRFTWKSSRGKVWSSFPARPITKHLRENPILYGNPILFPFPNRIRDGNFGFAVDACELPINEPERHNAIHGLVYHRPGTW